MDKIFSRNRIKLPNFDKFVYNKKARKFINIIAILLIAIIVFKIAVNATIPIIDEQCRTMAKSIATKISNEEATRVMADYDYEDFCMVEKDEDGNIKLISTNMITINRIISDIPILMQEALEKEENNTFTLKLGSFTGSKFFAGMGPDIKIKMMTDGTVETDLRSEFKEAGINQTLHRIYLEVKCNVNILTPYHTISETITNQVLLVEGVIIGNIPDAYYNLEGLNEEQSMEFIDWKEVTG